jgi:WD40 repeat protein
MNQARLAHPSSERLAAFALGRLSEAESAEIEPHVVACETCRAVVEATPADTLVELLRGVATPSAAPLNPSTVTSRSPDRTAGQARPNPGSLPEVFGRYRILKKLGQGGMGTVYLARDTQLDRPVALKVPHFKPGAGPKVFERFYREARLAATFTHPNLCPVYDVGEIEGIHYLTMPYLEGKPLSAFIDAAKPLPLRQAAAVVRKLALALAEAHQKGVIHRDLKPANVMINQRKEPVIMDFGLARQETEDESRLTAFGALLGTPSYMAPEQVQGDPAGIGPACDIYSLGVILYQLLTGQLPFQGPVTAVLGQVLVVEPPPPSTLRANLDPRLEAICLKAMAKKVANRYASMAELAAALADYLRAGDPMATAAASGAPSLAPPRSEATFDVAPGDNLPASAVAERAPQPELETRPARRRGRKARQRSRGPLWPWLAAATVLFAALALAGTIVIRLAGGEGEGTVVIDTDDADVEVAVLQGGKEVTILDKKSKHEIKLTAGTYEAELKGEKGNLRLLTPRFTLKRGDKEIVRVRHEVARPGGGVRAEEKPAVVPPQADAAALRGKAAIVEEGAAAPVPSGPVGEVRRFQGYPPKSGVARSLFSHDGKHIINTMGDVRVWDVQSGQTLRSFGQGLYGWGLALSPDGKQVFWATDDHFLRRYDVETGVELKRYHGHTARVDWVAVSPDGSRAATCSVDKTLRVWDVATGREVWRVSGHRYCVVAFSPDGGTLLASRDDKSMHLFEVERGQEVRSFHKDSYFSGVAFAPDGHLALSCDSDKKLRLWDVASGKVVRTLVGHDDAVWVAEFSRGGRRIISAGGDDRTVRLWDVASGKEVQRFFGHSGSVSDARFSPDGKYAVSCGFDGTVRLWRLPDLSAARPGAEVERPEHPAVEKAGEVRRFTGHRARVEGVAFSPDGRRALSGSEDGTAQLWDVKSGKQVRALLGHTRAVHQAVFSPDGRKALTCSDDRTARLWDVESGRELGQLKGHTERVLAVAFSPDGRRAATSGGDRHLKRDLTVRLWDLQTGKELLRLHGHTEEIWAVAFSPDGKRLASACDDKTVCLWDTATGKQLRRWADSTGKVCGLAYAPDGKSIVSSGQDMLIRLWDIAGDRETRRLEGHTGWVWRVAFSPDGLRIASCSDDKTARVWDTNTGQELARFEGANGPVAFAPDGRFLLTGSTDNSVRLWRLPGAPSPEPGGLAR